jgi:predicted acyltransferase
LENVSGGQDPAIADLREPSLSDAAQAGGVSPASRLYSLDALRGFDMVWIIGAEDILHSLAKTTGSPFWIALSDQFTHPDWNGFHLYDLIFPLFLFIAGVATPFSLEKAMEKGMSRRRLLGRIARRALLLLILGYIYNNGLQVHPLAEIRFPSVLGRIGVAYLFAAIIYLYAKPGRRMLVMGSWLCCLLIGYWLLLLLNAAPGFHHGDLSMEGNFVSYVDRLILPGKLYRGIHDPEGLLSTLPAIGTGLLGIMTGSFLKTSSLVPARRALGLAVAGLIGLLLAQIWNLAFPINKNLWTSSFVLQAGGLSLLLLALFYWVIDVRGYRTWSFFFRVIGLNSLLIYMSGVFIDWDYTNTACFHWLDQLVGAPWNSVVMACCLVGIEWAFLYFLYKMKVFLRI